jgi:hypothetical protein
MTLVEFAVSRSLKRVPLDFSWPLNKVWEGYVDPHWRRCPDCERGYTRGREVLVKLVRLIMIAGECAGKEGEAVHPWLREIGVEAISPDMAKLTSGLAGRRPLMGLGHDDGDVHRAEKKIVAAAGLGKSWGVCATCRGSGCDPSTKEASEAWRPTEPPAGVGWQLWETVGDGSPISPVHATMEELAGWCERNKMLASGDRMSSGTMGRWLDLFEDLADRVRERKHA